MNDYKKSKNKDSLMVILVILLDVLLIISLIVLVANKTSTSKAKSNYAMTEKAKIINAKIGQEVKYEGYVADYTGTWNVLYATDEEVFIITTETTEIGIDLKSKSEKYKGSEDVRQSTYGATWNSIWLSKCKGNESTTINAKAVAYLCDSSNWTTYLVTGASYAVGGPTMELLAISLKTSGGEDATSAFGLTTKEGYNVGFSNGFTGFYFVDGKPWWIASPSNGLVIDKTGQKRFHDQDISDDVQIVRGYGSINNEGLLEDDNASMGVRPVVCIPISNIDENTLMISNN